MKKLVPVVFFLLFTINLFPQYEIKSPYLQNPESIFGYVDSCAAFWQQVYDESNGGFFTNVSKEGEVISSWGRNKNLLTQTRHAYAYSRAYMMTGDTVYLDYAKRALDFMFEYAWDEPFGGWISQLNPNGTPSELGNKTAFDSHYAVMGILTYYEATGDTAVYSWLEKALQFNEEELWDSRENEFGYFDYTSRTTNIKQGKSFNATVDAITTHILYLWLMTKDDVYLQRLEQLADNITDHLVASMENQQIGFAEEYDANWNIDESETLTIMGHVLKTGWCLARMSYAMPENNYIPIAEQLVNEVYEKGYDHELGGPYKDYNRVTGEMQMWGVPDTGKAWWQMEQAVTSGLQLYHITGDEKYLQMADETLDFFMNYFVDHQYGEVYMDRTRYGGPLWHENKGDNNKASYHSVETAFYVYLYGNLFVHNKPVTLYYNYDPVDYPREFILTPLAIEEAGLLISSVEKDGTVYSDFSAENRVLNLPAGTGGEFKVVFTPDYNTSVQDDIVSVTNFELSQNYPNPFNPSTKISFSLPESHHVKLNVYSVLGERISTLYEGTLSAGTHSVSFDGTGLTSGIYIYRLETETSSITKKMILLK